MYNLLLNKNIAKFMKALFTEKKTLFTRIAHKSPGAFSNGVLEFPMGELCSDYKQAKSKVGQTV